MQCRSNLRQIGIALHSFHESHRRLPAGWSRDKDGRTAFGWASQILPQLQEQSLVSHIDFRSATDGATNAEARTVVPAVFLCPSDNALRAFQLFPEDYGQSGSHPGSAMSEDSHAAAMSPIELPASNYLGVFGTSDPDINPNMPGEGVFMQDRSCRFADLLRGQSNTFLVGERTARKLPSTWFGIVMTGEDASARVTGFADSGPNHSGSDECEFDSRHFGHVNLLYADGHVSAIQDSIDRTIYRRQATRNDSP